MEDNLQGGTLKGRKRWLPAKFGLIGTFLIIFSGILLLGAVVCSSGYSSGKRRLMDVRAAEPDSIRLEVDLSKPGEYSVIFQSYTLEFLRIETQRAFTSREEAIALLGGLEGLLEFTDFSGESIFKEKLSDCIASFPERKTGKYFPMLLRRDRPFIYAKERGEYKLKLTIHHGAPLLSGIPHVLVARRSELSGVEYTLVRIMGLASLVFSIMAGIIFWIAVWITKRNLDFFL